MNEYVFIGLGIFLIIIAIIDYYTRTIPSVLLTAGLFIVVALNQGNIFYGLMAFNLSYMLYEANFFGGMADIKVFTLFGFLLPSLYAFMIFIILFAVLGVSWKIIYKWKHPKEDECPFLPVFVFVFIGLLLIGGII